jgi:hypothetical protein
MLPVMTAAPSLLLIIPSCWAESPWAEPPPLADWPALVLPEFPSKYLSPSPLKRTRLRRSLFYFSSFRQTIAFHLSI